MAFKKLRMREPRYKEGELTPPGSLDTLLEVHQALIATEKRYGYPFGPFHLAKFMGTNSCLTHSYTHQLRRLGVINFEPLTTPLDIKIIVRENLEEIARETYAKAGFVVIMTRRSDNQSIVRRFRKIKIHECNGKHIAVGRGHDGRVLLNEWTGNEINDNEPYWLKDYTTRKKDFNIPDLKKKGIKYGEQKYRKTD